MSRLERNDNDPNSGDGAEVVRIDGKPVLDSKIEEKAKTLTDTVKFADYLEQAQLGIYYFKLNLEGIEKGYAYIKCEKVATEVNGKFKYNYEIVCQVSEGKSTVRLSNAYGFSGTTDFANVRAFEADKNCFSIAATAEIIGEGDFKAETLVQEVRSSISAIDLANGPRWRTMQGNGGVHVAERIN
jgi:hypothetical protein